MSGEDALRRLGQSTADAVTGALAAFCPGGVERHEVAVLPDGMHPLEALALPAVSSSVSYVDGVTGGNVFAMTESAARGLAAAMMGMEPEDEAGELSELELSAVAEATNQMMAAAAAATGAVLGQEVEISPPVTRRLETLEDALADLAEAPHVTSTGFSVAGQPCRLVQLVPHAFLVRMTRALDDLSADEPPAASSTATESGGEAATGSRGLALTGVPVRVWAELGRAELPIAKVVGLPPGAVVELDRDVEEPIEIYVNGLPFATGRLVVADGSDWAVRIDTVAGAERAA